MENHFLNTNIRKLDRTFSNKWSFEYQKNELTMASIEKSTFEYQYVWISWDIQREFVDQGVLIGGVKFAKLDKLQT